MKNQIVADFVVATLIVAALLPPRESWADDKPAARHAGFQLATFSADVTCPVGHPLLGGLRQPAREIVDPLLARGMVLMGSGEPIVLCAVDWCEIRNRSNDRWREARARVDPRSSDLRANTHTLPAALT